MGSTHRRQLSFVKSVDIVFHLIVCFHLSPKEDQRGTVLSYETRVARANGKTLFVFGFVLGSEEEVDKSAWFYKEKGHNLKVS